MILYFYLITFNYLKYSLRLKTFIIDFILKVLSIFKIGLIDNY